MKPEACLVQPAVLTPADKAEFARLDKIVSVTAQTLMEGGQVLGIISDRQLHRAGGFKSFAAYIDEHGFTDALASDLVRAARIVQRLRKPGKPAPNFRQATLFDDPEQAEIIWGDLVKTARGRITTKAVEDAILAATGRPAGAAVGEIDPAMAQAILAMSKADQAEILQRHADATVKAHSPAKQVGGEAADERGQQIRRLAERLLKLAEGNDRFERAADLIRQAIEVLGEGE